MDINDAIAALDDQINGLLRIRAGLVALSGQAATDEEGSCDLVGFDPNRKLDAIKMVRRAWTADRARRAASTTTTKPPARRSH